MQLLIIKKNITALCYIIILSFLYQDVAWTGEFLILDNVIPRYKNEAWIQSLISNIKIPEDIGVIKEKSINNLSPAKTILHIQDSHANYPAQMNIAKILETLYLQGVDITPPFLIAVEGAEGLVDVSSIRSFPYREAKEMVTDYLVRESLMTGAEFFLANSDMDKDILIWGVEDKELYKENLEAFREMQGYKDEAKRVIKEMEEDLKRLMDHNLNEQQREFISKMMAYQRDEIGLEEYARFLKSKIQNPKSKIPNFKKLIRLVKLKQQIDFSEVEKERMRLIKDISKKYTKEEVIAVVTKGLNYQIGKTSAYEYFKFLKGYIREIKEDRNKRLKNWKSSGNSKDFQNLLLYIDYIHLNSSVDTQLLFREIADIERQIGWGMFDGAIYQKALIVTIIDKFINLKIYREDLEYYNSRKQDFITNNAIAPFLESFRRFCELGIRRDSILFNNTIKKMGETGIDTAILVTGGFHTEGIKELFKDKDISYAIISPRITKMQDKKRYIDLLMKGADPLEKILAFSGTRLALWSEYCARLYPERGEGTAENVPIMLMDIISPYLKKGFMIDPKSLRIVNGKIGEKAVFEFKIEKDGIEKYIKEEIPFGVVSYKEGGDGLGKKNPDSKRKTDSDFLKGLNYFTDGKYKEAIGCFRKIRYGSGVYSNALIYLILAERRKGNKGGEEKYKKKLKKYIEDRDMRGKFRSGATVVIESMRKKRDFIGVIDCCKMLLEVVSAKYEKMEGAGKEILSNNLMWIYEQMASSYEYLYEIDKAVDCFEKSVSYKREPGVLVKLSRLYKMVGRYEDSIRVTTEVKEKSSKNDLTSDVKIGLIYYNAGRYYKVIEIFEGVLNKIKKGGYILWEREEMLKGILAKCYLRVGEIDRVLNYAEELKGDRDRKGREMEQDIYILLINCYIESGEIELARDYYQELKKMWPRNKAVRLIGKKLYPEDDMPDEVSPPDIKLEKEIYGKKIILTREDFSRICSYHLITEENRKDVYSEGTGLKSYFPEGFTKEDILEIVKGMDMCFTSLLGEDVWPPNSYVCYYKGIRVRAKIIQGRIVDIIPTAGEGCNLYENGYKMSMNPYSILVQRSTIINKDSGRYLVPSVGNIIPMVFNNSVFKELDYVDREYLILRALLFGEIKGDLLTYMIKDEYIQDEIGSDRLCIRLDKEGYEIAHVDNNKKAQADIRLLIIVNLAFAFMSILLLRPELFWIVLGLSPTLIGIVNTLGHFRNQIFIQIVNELSPILERIASNREIDFTKISTEDVQLLLSPHLRDKIRDWRIRVRRAGDGYAELYSEKYPGLTKKIKASEEEAPLDKLKKDIIAKEIEKNLPEGFIEVDADNFCDVLRLAGIDIDPNDEDLIRFKNLLREIINRRLSLEHQCYFATEYIMRLIESDERYKSNHRPIVRMFPNRRIMGQDSMAIEDYFHVYPVITIAGEEFILDLSFGQYLNIKENKQLLISVLPLKCIRENECLRRIFFMYTSGYSNQGEFDDKVCRPLVTADPITSFIKVGQIANHLYDDSQGDNLLKDILLNLMCQVYELLVKTAVVYGEETGDKGYPYLRMALDFYISAIVRQPENQELLNKLSNPIKGIWGKLKEEDKEEIMSGIDSGIKEKICRVLGIDKEMKRQPPNKKAEEVNRISELNVLIRMFIYNYQYSHLRKEVKEWLKELIDKYPEEAVGFLIPLLYSSDSNLVGIVKEGLVTGAENNSDILNFIVKNMHLVAKKVQGKEELINLFLEVGDESIAPLIKKLGEDNYDVMKITSEALSQLFFIADDKSADVIKNSLIRICKDKRKILERIVRRMDIPEGSRRKDEELIDMFVKIGDAAIGPLTRILGDDSERVVNIAKRAILEIDCIKKFVGYGLRVKDDAVVERVVAMLIEIGRKAVGPLTGVLRNESEEVCKRAVKTLAGIGGPAIESLVNVLRDKDEKVRAYAMDALNKICSKSDKYPIRACRELFRNGIRLFKVKEYEEALEFFIWAHEKNPADVMPMIYIILSSTYLGRDKEVYEKQIRGFVDAGRENREVFRKAIMKAIWHLEAYDDKMSIIGCYYILIDVETKEWASTQDDKRKEELNCYLSNNYRRIAFLYEEIGKIYKAIECWESARHYREDERNVRQLSRLYRQDGQWDKAREMAARWKEYLSKNDIAGDMELIFIEYYCGDYQEVIRGAGEILNKVNSGEYFLSSDRTSIIKNIAIKSYLKLGMITEGLDFMRAETERLKEDGRYEDIEVKSEMLLHLIDYSIEADEYDKAREYYKKLSAICNDKDLIRNIREKVFPYERTDINIGALQDVILKGVVDDKTIILTEYDLAAIAKAHLLERGETEHASMRRNAVRSYFPDGYTKNRLEEIACEFIENGSCFTEGLGEYIWPPEYLVLFYDNICILCKMRLNTDKTIGKIVDLIPVAGPGCEVYKGLNRLDIGILSMLPDRFTIKNKHSGEYLVPNVKNIMHIVFDNEFFKKLPYEERLLLIFMAFKEGEIKGDLLLYRITNKQISDILGSNEIRIDIKEYSLVKEQKDWEKDKDIIKIFISEYVTQEEDKRTVRYLLKSFDRIGMIAPGESWRVIIGGSENVDEPFILLQYPTDGHPVLNLKVEEKEQKFNVILPKEEGNPARLDTDVIIVTKDGNKTLPEFLTLQGVQLDKATLGMDPFTTESAGYIYQDNIIARRDYDKILWVSPDKVPVGISPASDKNRLPGEGEIPPVLAYHVHPTTPHGESTILSPGDIEDIIDRYDLVIKPIIPELILDRSGNARLFIPRGKIDWKSFMLEEYPELKSWFQEHLLKDNFTKDEYSQLVQIWLQKLTPYFIIVTIEDFKHGMERQQLKEDLYKQESKLSLFLPIALLPCLAFIETLFSPSVLAAVENGISNTISGSLIRAIYEVVIRILKYLLDNPIYPVVAILAITSFMVYIVYLRHSKRWNVKKLLEKAKEAQAFIEGTKKLAPFIFPARTKIILFGSIILIAILLFIPFELIAAVRIIRGLIMYVLILPILFAMRLFIIETVNIWRRPPYKTWSDIANALAKVSNVLVRMLGAHKYPYDSFPRFIFRQVPFKNMFSGEPIDIVDRLLIGKDRLFYRQYYTHVWIEYIRQLNWHLWRMEDPDWWTEEGVQRFKNSYNRIEKKDIFYTLYTAILLSAGRQKVVELIREIKKSRYIDKRIKKSLIKKIAPSIKASKKLFINLFSELKEVADTDYPFTGDGVGIINKYRKRFEKKLTDLTQSIALIVEVLSQIEKEKPGKARPKILMFLILAVLNILPISYKTPLRDMQWACMAVNIATRKDEVGQTEIMTMMIVAVAICTVLFYGIGSIWTIPLILVILLAGFGGDDNTASIILDFLSGRDIYELTVGLGWNKKNKNLSIVFPEFEKEDLPILDEIFVNDIPNKTGLTEFNVVPTGNEFADSYLSKRKEMLPLIKDWREKVRDSVTSIPQDKWQRMSGIRRVIKGRFTLGDDDNVLKRFMQHIIDKGNLIYSQELLSPRSRGDIVFTGLVESPTGGYRYIFISFNVKGGIINFSWMFIVDTKEEVMARLLWEVMGFPSKVLNDKEVRATFIQLMKESKLYYSPERKECILIEGKKNVWRINHAGKLEELKEIAPRRPKGYTEIEKITGDFYLLGNIPIYPSVKILKVPNDLVYRTRNTAKTSGSVRGELLIIVLFTIASIFLPVLLADCRLFGIAAICLVILFLIMGHTHYKRFISKHWNVKKLLEDAKESQAIIEGTKTLAPFIFPARTKIILFGSIILLAIIAFIPFESIVVVGIIRGLITVVLGISLFFTMRLFIIETVNIWRRPPYKTWGDLANALAEVANVLVHLLNKHKYPYGSFPRFIFRQVPFKNMFSGEPIDIVDRLLIGKERLFYRQYYTDIWIEYIRWLNWHLWCVENPDGWTKEEVLRFTKSYHSVKKSDIYYTLYKAILLSAGRQKVVELIKEIKKSSDIFERIKNRLKEEKKVPPLKSSKELFEKFFLKLEEVAHTDYPFTGEGVGIINKYKKAFEKKLDDLKISIALIIEVLSKIEPQSRGTPSKNRNITCGTVCKSGHNKLDKQLKRQFEKLEKILEAIPDDKIASSPAAPRNDKLTEDEADMALVEYAKRFGIEITKEQLSEYREQIRDTDEAFRQVQIFFFIPETGTELFWVGEDYAGGHFNRPGTRIHISLPIILNRGIGAGIAIAKHDLAHIQGKGHQDDSGMKLVSGISALNRLQKDNLLHGITIREANREEMPAEKPSILPTAWISPANCDEILVNPDFIEFLAYLIEEGYDEIIIEDTRANIKSGFIKALINSVLLHELEVHYPQDGSKRQEIEKLIKRHIYIILPVRLYFWLGLVQGMGIVEMRQGELPKDRWGQLIKEFSDLSKDLDEDYIISQIQSVENAVNTSLRGVKRRSNPDEIASHRLAMTDDSPPITDRIQYFGDGDEIVKRPIKGINKVFKWLWDKVRYKILIFLALAVLNILPISCGGNNGGIGPETGGQSSYLSGESDTSTGGTTDEYPDKLPLAGDDKEWTKGNGYRKATFSAKDLRSYYCLVFEDIKKAGGSSNQLNILVQLLDSNTDIYTEKGICRTPITIMQRESTLSIHLDAFEEVDLSKITGIVIYYNTYPGIDMENEHNDGEPSFAGASALRVEEIGGVVPFDKIARGIINGFEKIKENPEGYYCEEIIPKEGERMPLFSYLTNEQVVALFGMDMPIEDRIKKIAELYNAGAGEEMPPGTIILLRKYYLKNKPAIQSVVPVIIDVTAIEELGEKIKTILNAFIKDGIQCGILPLVIETKKDKNAVDLLKKIGIEGFDNNIISGKITKSAIDKKIDYFISGQKGIMLDNSYIITTEGHEDMLSELLGEAAAIFVVGGERYRIAKYNGSNLRELIEVGRALGTDIIHIVRKKLREDGKDEKSINMMLEEALEGDPRRNTGEYSEKPKEYKNQRQIKTQL